jgi:hypothetical protein
MKHGIAAAIALATTTLAPLASAATYVYTFNDMSSVPDQAANTFNTARYWENRGTDRWGTVWTRPLTFSTTFPTSEGSSHFHIGYKDYQCSAPGAMNGKWVNGVCVALDPAVNRGPFLTHVPTEALYFELVKNNKTTMVPFVVKKIDVYNAASESINLYVRKQTDGKWFYWGPLHGHLDGSPNWYRWILSSGYTGKFTAMAWRALSGVTYPAMVGRVEITD